MKAISLNQSLSKKTIVDRLLTWLDGENQTLSTLMEESVSNRQMLLASNAMVSGIILVCSAFTCIEAALFLLVWFCWSILVCEKGGMA